MMITWHRDMLRFARTGFGLWARRPKGAPPTERRRPRLRGAAVSESPNMLNPLAWRLEYQVAGIDALAGLTGPVVVASNEQGVLDWRVLQAALPSQWRTTTRWPNRSLARGRSVVVFSEPSIAGGAGEFTTVPAELANLHNVPIVPVALVGTWRLKESLRLALKRRPKVSVRFGSPIYVRRRSLEQVTTELQAAVSALCDYDDLSWWALQQHGPVKTDGVEMPRWRRMWQQTTPRRTAREGIWPRT